MSGAWLGPVTGRMECDRRVPLHRRWGADTGCGRRRYPETAAASVGGADTGCGRRRYPETAAASVGGSRAAPAAQTAAAAAAAAAGAGAAAAAPVTPSATGWGQPARALLRCSSGLRESGSQHSHSCRVPAYPPADHQHPTLADGCTHMTIAEFFMMRPHGPNCWMGLGAFSDRVRL